VSKGGAVLQLEGVWVNGWGGVRNLGERMQGEESRRAIPMGGEKRRGEPKEMQKIGENRK